MITGESFPVNKEVGNEVIGGTITNGSVKIKASKVKDETLLSQIISLVKNAQNNKPNIQKLGDKISAYFVPIVIGISILTFLGYLYFGINFQDALLRSIAVLVISCPCAMGLATPTAVMVGIGRAFAKNGILIKGGDTIEKIASIKSIIFDKTGTLTNGKFEISKLNIIDR